MFYPRDFQNKVKSLLGNDTVCTMLESGDTSLGRLLAEKASQLFTADEILNASYLNSFDTLVQRAKKQNAIKEVFTEWEDLFEDWKEYCTNHKIPLE